MMIENAEVYGLENSIRASKYPMSTDTKETDFNITDTVCRLGSSGRGTGHDNFLCGIVVQFDLTFSSKAWVEAERYHFFDIVSSQSTMHRIERFDIRSRCNEWVTDDAIENLERLIRIYQQSPTSDNRLRVLYNIPSGFELTARVTTNYRQLKTIYYQRKDHRLPEWRAFCEWIEILPQFKTIVLNKED